MAKVPTNQSGFTLLELIITLVAIGILVTLVILFNQ